MSHPLTACISEIELLHERIAEKNDRIEALEAALILEWAARDNRIGRLEAALRIFADDENWRFGRRLDPNGSRFDGTSVAQIALAPEQDK